MSGISIVYIYNYIHTNKHEYVLLLLFASFHFNYILIRRLLLLRLFLFFNGLGEVPEPHHALLLKQTPVGTCGALTRSTHHTLVLSGTQSDILSHRSAQPFGYLAKASSSVFCCV